MNAAFRHWVKRSTATLFSALFMLVSFAMIILAISRFTDGIEDKADFVSAIISAINDLFIALATYELAMGIFKEYRGNIAEDKSLFMSIRRTVTRFVSVVVIALVLEGLIMIIKYSQFDMAGNLFYPVAVIIAASLLLISLGGFLALTRNTV